MTPWRHLAQDLGVIAISAVVAIFLVGSDTVETLLTATRESRLIGSFFAGLFFTTVFTTAPAIVALGEIAQSGSVLATAAVGALGAVIGDIIIFLMVRDRLSGHLAEHLKRNTGWLKFMILVRTRSFRWLSFFIGGLIIASPIPDEVGISLMGFSKVETRWFVPLSFAFNFTGILAIGAVAKSLT